MSIHQELSPNDRRTPEFDSNTENDLSVLIPTCCLTRKAPVEHQTNLSLQDTFCCPFGDSNFGGGLPVATPRGVGQQGTTSFTPDGLAEGPPTLELDQLIRVGSPRDDPEVSSSEQDVVTVFPHQTHFALDADAELAGDLLTASQWSTALDPLQPLLPDSTRHFHDRPPPRWTPQHQRVGPQAEPGWSAGLRARPNLTCAGSLFPLLIVLPKEIVQKTTNFGTLSPFSSSY